MTAFSVPLSLFLAAVFVMSAVGKLLSADRGRAGFEALRIRVAHPNAAATCLIVVEAAVAIALVATTGWFFVAASAASVALTAALLFAVMRAHRLGSTDPCGCFGDWLPAAIGPRLIARDAVLLVIAIAVFLTALLAHALVGVPIGIPYALAAGPGAVTAFGALLALALTALATWAIARSSVDASGAGPIAHGGGAVVLPVTGQIVDVLAPGTRARLILFVSPGCHACAGVLTRLQAVQAEVDALTDVYVVQRVVHGPILASVDHGVPETAHLALDVGGSLGATLALGTGRPVAALIGADGTQAGPLALGGAEATALIDSIVSLVETPTS